MATAVLLPSARPQSILVQHIPSPPSTSRRRIRFAPLPDPRRSVLITDDGNELPFPQPTLATQFPAPPTPSPAHDSRTDYFTGPDNASLSSSSSGSKQTNDSLVPSSSSSVSSTPGTATPISITTTPNESDNPSSVPPSPVSSSTPPLTAVSSKLSVHSATPVPSSSKSRPFSFFRRLKRNSISSSSSSSNTLTPVASIDRTSTPTFSRRNFSAEEILTLGTINLFRPSSSRDTSDSETGSATSSSWGWSLARLSSTNSSASHHHPKEPTWGHPLARASSTQSYQSKAKSTKTKSKGPRVPGSRKGTRMLNGRVYGVKRPQNANPFANARDEEPEFVEWGYGGMGSVKGATNAGAHSRWERLHGTSTTAPSEVKPETNVDDDDGSGLAWIKKRREQREKEKEEKEKREREELEKAESADNETPLPQTTPLATLSPQSLDVKERIPSRPGTATSAKTTLSASSSITITPTGAATPRPTSMPMQLSLPLPTPTLTVTPPTSSSAVASPAALASSATTPSGEEEHVTRAVNVPAPTRHYHHRPHSRAGSKDQTMMESLLCSARVKDAVQSPRDHQASDSTSSTSASETESETDEDDEEDDDDDESSDEEEQRSQERKTALGAGVEKISRHHSS